MPSLSFARPLFFALLMVLAVSCLAAPAADSDWIDLTNLDAWRKPDDLWQLAGSAGIDLDNPKRLSDKSGKEILVNGKKGRARDC